MSIFGGVNNPGVSLQQLTTAERNVLVQFADLSLAQGDVLYVNSSGQWAVLAPGTSGNVLATQGAAADPHWVSQGGSGVTIGTTTITSGTNTRILYDNSGVLGEYTISGSGTVVAMATSPSLTTPALGVATATSIAIGGATIGSNGLAVTGHVLLEGVTSTGATGTGRLVFDGSPTLVTPVLGAATATSINGLTISSSTGTLTITNLKTVSHTATTTFGGTDGKTVAFNNSLTFAGTDSTTMTFPAASDTVAALGTTQTFTGIQTLTPTARSSGSAAYFVINTPADTAQTAATESIGIKTVTATRTWATTGTVALQREIFFAGPTYASASASQTFTDATTLHITPPVVGSNAVFTRGHSLTIVDSTSAASSITGGFVIAATLGTTATSVGIGGGNINAGGTLTVGGHVTVEGVTSTGATGTGKFVFDGTPTLVTPVLGVATATSINKVALTAPATSATLTIADGKTLTVSQTMTLTSSGTSSVITFPNATDTVGGLGTAQTWTAQNKFNNIVDVNNAITASSNAATVPVTFRLNTVTNNSAATLTITMTTTSAVDGQMTVVRILDSSAAAQTITWVNTENSTVSAPTTSNGSTTLPLTVGFQYNSATSKWRCIASV